MPIPRLAGDVAAFRRSTRSRPTAAQDPLRLDTVTDAEHSGIEHETHTVMRLAGRGNRRWSLRTVANATVKLPNFAAHIRFPQYFGSHSCLDAAIASKRLPD
ncbi:hypothetical protein AJ87_37405 [Rhizobium yanglingense]|nr:hypothetical protein AJ87_37405 [Rhizobium yanglingense]